MDRLRPATVKDGGDAVDDGEMESLRSRDGNVAQSLLGIWFPNVWRLISVILLNIRHAIPYIIMIPRMVLFKMGKSITIQTGIHRTISGN
jgi:hypothetical protein